jgi:hypothetical protein
MLAVSFQGLAFSLPKSVAEPIPIKKRLLKENEEVLFDCPECCPAMKIINVEGFATGTISSGPPVDF